MDDLKARQQYWRERMWSYLGERPSRTPLNARIAGRLDRGDFRIEKIVFESRPGFYVTANLYLPATGRPPYPAISRASRFHLCSLFRTAARRASRP